MKKKNEEIIEKFESDLKSQNFSKGSIHTYSVKVRAYVAWLESQGIEITKADIDVLKKYADHLRANGNKHKTIRNVFASINSLYGFLKWEKMIKGDNPVPPVMKRYLRTFKESNESERRRSISVEEASNLVNSIINSRDKALVTLLFKTGCRASEALSIELYDIDWSDQSVQLKPFAKRTNKRVFFDDETRVVLDRWLRSRATWNTNSEYLFLGRDGSGPMKIDALEKMFKKYARDVKLDDPNSNRIEDHLSPHCCRHWFETQLRKNGMPREFRKELRGDARRDAIDLYDHIDPVELKKSYLACIPLLGV